MNGKSVLGERLEGAEAYARKHFRRIQLCFAGIALVVLAFLLAAANSEAFRTGLIQIAEKVKNRPLNHAHWHNRFLRYTGRVDLMVLAVLLFSDCLFSFCLFRRTVEKSALLRNVTCAGTGCFAALFILLILDGGNGWGGDFSEYIAQARSLVTGTLAQQVRDNTYIIQNSPPMLGDAVYPWGFPFLLAPFYALFGKNLFMLKLPVLLCFAAAVVLVNLLFRRHFSFFQAELLTLFIAVNPVFLFFCNTPLSDIPFLTFSLAALYALDVLLYESERKKQLAAGMAAGLLIFCAYFIRSNGIILPCLLCAMHALLLLNRNRKIAGVCRNLGFSGFAKPFVTAHIIPYVLFAVLFLLQKQLLPHAGGTYVQNLRLITKETILDNCSYYLWIFVEFFPFGPRLSACFYAWLAVFFLYGFMRYLFSYPLFSVFFVGILAVLIMWPCTEGLRFCFPMIPVMIFFAALGMRDFLRCVSCRNFHAAGICIELLCVMLCLRIYGRRGMTVSDEYGAYSRDARELYAYVVENTAADAKMIFFKPRVLYLETGRLGFQAYDIRRLSDADYLILSREGYGTFGYDIESIYPEESRALDKVFENASMKMYRILQ